MSNNITVHSNSMGIGNVLYLIMAILTARIGYFVNDSIFWAIVDFIFWPFVWIKWLICEDVNMAIIKQAFSFFFN